MIIHRERGIAIRKPVIRFHRNADRRFSEATPRSEEQKKKQKLARTNEAKDGSEGMRAQQVSTPFLRLR
jgi:hypothetical protein